jgi:PAS domain S-box-containing protein
MSSSPSRQPNEAVGGLRQEAHPVELDFLGGGGEMGALIGAYDWAASPLGPVSTWPHSLRTAVGIMLTSRYAMFIWWGQQLTNLYNDAYRPFLGKKHPRSLGQSARHVWEEIWELIGPRTNVVLEHGESTFDEALLLIMERFGYPEETYFTFSYSPIRDDHGAVGGIFCAVTDETRRVIGERRLKLLREVAASCSGLQTPDHVCSAAAECISRSAHDLPFALLYLNEPGGRVTRLIAQAGIDRSGSATEMVADSEASASLWPFGKAARENDAVVVEELASRLNPVPMGAWDRPAAQAVVVPLREHGHAAVAGFLVAGLNPYLPFGEEYRGFVGLLADQLTAGIARARAYQEERRRAEALAEIDRAKTAFFSNVSHEFRTPLTLMLGPMEDAVADPDTPQRVRSELELAHRNALRLLKLVNSLLDFSRIEAGRVQASYEPTDLAAVTRDLASTFRSAIERAGLELLVEFGALEEPVYLDREMWEKIVLNLLSNAFKFTLQGSITVRLRREGQDAILEVADTGVGIPEHELPHLFQRFHRVEGTSGRTQEGSGIGLALVQELVKLHGGTLCATSTPGCGTTLRIRLPFGTTHLPAERIKAPRSPSSTAVGAQVFVQEALRWLAPGTEETSSRLPPIAERRAPVMSHRLAQTVGARIVLADDNADMRDYIRDLLSPTYVVEAVADGAQALAAARRQLPDLILSDIMMPRVDGLELLKAMRADEGLRDVPIILLSARAGEEARVEGLEAGADDYLIKPFSARELTARVGAHLALRQARRETLVALSESEQRIRELFRQAPGFMCILGGPDHVYEFSNDSHRLLVGDRELLGKPVREVLPELEGQGYIELLDQVYRTGESVIGNETSLRLRSRPDGPVEPPRFVDFIYQPIRDAAGAVTGIFVEGFDVTSRVSAAQALHRSEELRQLALDASRMGTFTWYPEEDRSKPDARMLELFGLATGSKLTLSSALATLIHADDRIRYAESVSRALDSAGDGALHEDIRIIRPDDGSERWLAISGQVFFEGEPRRAVRMIGTAMDITERKRVEETLKLADLQKDEFLAMLSHELRNPLAPISMASTLLSRTGGRDDRTQFAIQTIQRQTRQLTRLVDDLLDVSRIARGRIVLQHQPIDLATVITQAVETVEPQLREKQHRICVTTSSYHPLYVSGDLTRLVQCMVNVLGNAAKYTDAGGEIRVETRADGSCAVIEVSDTGAGIPPEMLSRIFDLFVQGQRTLDRAQGGLGIGLSVVKRLVEMHDGQITARSPGLGRGSQFEIRLPRIARPQSRPPEATPITTPPKRVVIVDDNTDAANTLAALLNYLGHETLVALSGKEALARLQTFEPEVVLLDIGLPEMNGYELARRLRTDPRWRGIRLIALTGYGQTEDRQRVREAGFDDHLVKPVDVDALQRSLALTQSDRVAPSGERIVTP